MSAKNERPTVYVDGYTRFCLGAIAALLTVLILGLWATGPAGLSGRAAGADRAPAPGAGILPDAGAQRAALLEAVQATNQKLDQIKNILETGKLQVVVVEMAAEKQGAPDVKKAPANAK